MPMRVQCSESAATFRAPDKAAVRRAKCHSHGLDVLPSGASGTSEGSGMRKDIRRIRCTLASKNVLFSVCVDISHVADGGLVVSPAGNEDRPWATPRVVENHAVDYRTCSHIVTTIIDLRTTKVDRP